MGLDAPENKLQNARIQNYVIRLEGRFTHLYRSFPCRFHWISCVDSREPMNDLSTATADARAIFE